MTTTTNFTDVAATTFTGNLVGNVTGNVVGGAKELQTAVTADGAITIPLVSTTFVITKAGVAAMTLADPTATTHDGVRLTFLSTTANAHTLDNSAGSGFNGAGAGADIGTFGGAIADLIVVEAYQGAWYVILNTNVTLA